MGAISPGMYVCQPRAVASNSVMRPSFSTIRSSVPPIANTLSTERTTVFSIICFVIIPPRRDTTPPNHLATVSAGTYCAALLPLAAGQVRSGLCTRRLHYAGRQDVVVPRQERERGRVRLPVFPAMRRRHRDCLPHGLEVPAAPVPAASLRALRSEERG